MENQEHTTGDLVLTLSLVSTSLAFCAFILSRGMVGQEQAQAQDKAQSIAIQLLNGGVYTNLIDQGRGPASIDKASYLGELGRKGQISKDPWGRPFKYYIEKDRQGLVSNIFVISGGPDGRLETSFPEPDKPLKLKSDDIGIQHKVQM